MERRQVDMRRCSGGTDQHVSAYGNDINKRTPLAQTPRSPLTESSHSSGRCSSCQVALVRESSFKLTTPSRSRVAAGAALASSQAPSRCRDVDAARRSQAAAGHGSSPRRGHPIIGLQALEASAVPRRQGREARRGPGALPLSLSMTRSGSTEPEGPLSLTGRKSRSSR